MEGYVSKASNWLRARRVSANWTGFSSQNTNIITWTMIVHSMYNSPGIKVVEIFEQFIEIKKGTDLYKSSYTKPYQTI